MTVPPAPEALPEPPDEQPEQQEWPRPWMAAFLDSLRNQGIATAAARAAKISKKTAYQWRAYDERFRLAWLDAVDEGIDMTERLVHARGTTGTPLRKTVTRTSPDGSVETTVTDEMHVSDRCLLAWLAAMRPEKWKRNIRVEQTNPEGTPTAGQVAAIEDTLADFRAELDRLAD